MPFRDRNRTYLIGYGGVVLAATLGIIGLVAPGWLTLSSYDPPELKFFGLWLSCSYTSEGVRCGFTDYSSYNDYWKATQAMACIGVALLVVSTLFGLYVNVLSTNLPSSPLLEITAFLGFLFLFLGCMVCVGYKENHLSGVSYGYAMILSTVGSLVAFLSFGCVTSGSGNPPSPMYQVFT